jgi:hypothetical protein
MVVTCCLQANTERRTRLTPTELYIRRSAFKLLVSYRGPELFLFSLPYIHNALSFTSRHRDFQNHNDDHSHPRSASNGINARTMNEKTLETTTESQQKVINDAPQRSLGNEEVVEIDRQKDETQPSGIPHSLGFYMLVVGLCLAGLATSLEATITSTALPTIIDVLGGADLYIWVVNGYYLTMYVKTLHLLC